MAGPNFILSFFVCALKHQLQFCVCIYLISIGLCSLFTFNGIITSKIPLIGIHIDAPRSIIAEDELNPSNWNLMGYNLVLYFISFFLLAYEKCVLYLNIHYTYVYRACQIMHLAITHWTTQSRLTRPISVKRINRLIAHI